MKDGTPEWSSKRLSDIGLAFPTVYIVPSEFDTGGLTGGQMQARPSFKKPAAQTFPPEIKSCERSRFPNGVLLTIDVKQSEIRVAALLSGDESLISDLKSGVDIHADRATEFFGPHWRDEPNAEKLRWAAKQTVFGDLFWASPPTLQRTILDDVGILVPISKCNKIVARRPHLRPTLYQWQKDTLAKAKRDGRLELPLLGLSRHFDDFGPKERSEVINFPVQATSAVNLNSLQIRLHTHHLPPLNHPNPPYLLFVNIYDSLTFDCQNPDAALELRSHLEEAASWLQTDGYWALLQRSLGRKTPLAFEFTTDSF